MKDLKNNEGDRMMVVKDNALINASYNLDLVEQRLILLAIVEARESGKGISAILPLEIHASSYAQTFNVERQAAYKALKSACDNLFTRQFSYQSLSDKGNIQTHRARWVSEVIYVEQEACVKLVFSTAVAPMFTRLEERFTSYEMTQVAKLSSKYSTRLYELMAAWRAAGKTPIFELENFRRKLGLGVSEYKGMSDFKKYVLDLAIKQINEHSDIHVNYEQHKKGRTITGFSFKLKQKTEKPAAKIRDMNTPDFFIDMTDSQRYMFATKLSKLHEMSEYSSGNESFEDFSKRIADMLLIPEKFRTFYPLLVQLGFN